MKVGVGIATLNGFQRVDRLLSSIQQHTVFEGDYEVAVCDDGSSEANLKRLIAVCKSYSVPLIEHGENRGISATWNDLTKFFDSPLMVLLNDDLVMVDDWLRAMAYFMLNNRVGACGLPMWHGLPDAVKEKTSRRHWIAPYILEVKDTPIRCLYAPGPCFIFRRGLWKLVGGFDQRYRSFYEDIDFGTKLARLGWLSYILPYPTIFHEWGKTFAENPQLRHEQRMIESRKLYIQTWGGDQGEIMERYTYSWGPRHVRWLGEGGVEKEGEEEAR